MIRRLRARVHGFLGRMLHEHTEPSRLALGVFVGAVVGCSPLFGLHLFVCMAVAYVLGLNQFVVYGAANISIPPLVPFIAFSSVQLGERLRHGRWMDLRLHDISWHTAPELAKQFFLDWLLGGLLVGASVGLVAAVVVYVIVHRRRPVDAVGLLLRQAGRRYAGLPQRFAMYARLKYRMDPCYRAILPLVPPDSFTVDLGTGLGMLPVALALAAENRRALGVEWDVAKAEAGQTAAEGLDAVEITTGDVREFAIPPCDVITLVDMLHYYDADTQRALLRRCRDALRPHGRMLVREGDGRRRGGARFTRFVESTVTRLGWNRGPAVRFRPIDELSDDLTALGFVVRVDEVAGKLHPGNVLLVAELPPSAITE